VTLAKFRDKKELIMAKLRDKKVIEVVKSNPRDVP
jgi:hypothetical protein